MSFKHYPVIDRETSFMGLELIDFGILLISSMLIGLFFFIIKLKFIAILSFVLSLLGGYIFVRRLKEGKEKGYFVRWIHSKLRGHKVVY